MPSTFQSPLSRHLGTALLALLAQLPLAHAAFAGKDVVFGVASTFTTLDPYDANDTLSLSAGKSMYQGLVGFDANMKVVNVLAESVEVSKNNLEYTFKLRKGVKFHDGTEFKADAVKAVLDRVTNPDNKLKRFNLFNRVAKTDIINDYTVKITLKEPFSAFLNSMAHPSAMMISPTALKKYGNKEIAFHPVGTGPYQFVEWKATDYLKVKKFDGYWKKGLPKVDSLTFKPVIDNNTRSSVLQTGEAHFVYPVPYEQIDLLKTKPNLQVVSTPSILTRYIALNQLQKPFDNLKVRQALNYAVNKEALAKIAFSGQAVPAPGVVPQGVDFAVKKAPWPYDPAKARQLLKEAGYPNGFETELWASHNHSTAQKVIQFVQQQLAQVGVKAKLTALEAGQRVEKVESAPKAESAPVRMYYSGWSSSTGEADWALRPLLASESFPPKLFNIAYYKNPAVDSAIAAALTTNDRKEKEKQYAIAQDAVWADAPWIFLVNEKLIFAHSKQLSGVSLLPDASFSFEEMDLSAAK